MTDKLRRRDALPRSLPPLGLSREVAADFIGVSPSKFDEMVADGRMPKPKRIDSRRVWDRRRIEEAFSALPGDEDANEWDVVFDLGPGDLREQLPPWPRRLLQSLYRAGGRAAVGTIEASGPVSRRELIERRYMTEEGDDMKLTPDGIELAKRWR